MKTESENPYPSPDHRLPTDGRSGAPKTRTKIFQWARREDPLNAETPDDSETLESLALLGSREALERYHVKGVRTVLVVLSTRYVFDAESLRQKILLAYPEAAVFFKTTSGKPLGVDCPKSVDLLIDLTGPGNRQGWFYARKLRKMARVAVGRNARLFRNSYDRIFDEFAPQHARDLPADPAERERMVQRAVLELGGVPMIPAGDPTEDRAKSIALELPPLKA